MIKLIASDMDGTLLNDKQQISLENIEAINKAGKAGIKFMAATGREYASVKNILKTAGITCPCILVNGAELREIDGTLIDTIIMEDKDILEVLKVLDSHGLVANIMTDDGIYVTTDNMEEFEEDMMKRLAAYNAGLSIEERKLRVEDMRKAREFKLIDNMDEFLGGSTKKLKIEAFHEDEEVVKSINTKLKEIPNLAIASAGPHSIEVTDCRAQKGTVLKSYIKTLNILPEEVAVFGDSLNDESLFTEFKYAYAPSNGMQVIKDMAYEVIGKNTEHSVGTCIFNIMKQQNSQS